MGRRPDGLVEKINKLETILSPDYNKKHQYVPFEYVRRDKVLQLVKAFAEKLVRTSNKNLMFLGEALELIQSAKGRPLLTVEEILKLKSLEPLHRRKYR